MATTRVRTNGSRIRPQRIGCIGEAVTSANLPSGIFDSPGTAVIPSSLYLEQLRERLGEAALVDIGYGVEGKKKIKRGLSKDRE